MEKTTLEKLVIKEWAPEDRPREKLLLYGRQHLSDAELIAILLGSGNTNETAVDLARRILADSSFNLMELGKRSLKDFMQYKGVGEAKAISITAALELGRRRDQHTLPERPIIRSSQDSFKVLYPLVADLPVEHFFALYLNRQNKVITHHKISSGGVSGTVVDSRNIFSKGMELMASSIILCHNHPSGNLTPSQQDIQLTKKLEEGAKLLDMCILDHLIIAGSHYFSFRDEGKM